jgi:ABC-type Fe3+-hydroxamate transport system substrate-binding protein
MVSNSTWKDLLVTGNYADAENKFVDSILISENSMNLTTLSYLKPDIIFDVDVNKLSNVYQWS